MKNKRSFLVLVGLIIIFFFRFFLSLKTYNADINNHIAWVENINTFGWQDIYSRDLSPNAKVNYPPLTLYSFWLSEKIYDSLPPSLQTQTLHTSAYKLPSLLADCLIAYLIWVLLPFSPRWKLISMFFYLFNPALIYNSVYWGQIESLSALTAIATIFALINKRGELAIIIFTLGLLTKQNILPLIPIFLLGLYLSHTQIKKLLAAGLISLGIIILSYAPLIPTGVNSFQYLFHSYLSSIGGQAHQYQSSVNALNFWYLLGQNTTSDISTRSWGLVLTFFGTLISLYWFWRLRTRPYLAYWFATFFLSLWTFVFATRMHERHSYMAVAYLTFLLPFSTSRKVAILISGISFYNLYAVWSGYFYASPSPTWSAFMSIFSGIMVLVAIFSFFLPLQFLHQNRIKSEVVDRGKS